MYKEINHPSHDKISTAGDSLDINKAPNSPKEVELKEI